MSVTNVQDEILLNQLNQNGVYTSEGVLIPEPVPLTSAFANAVAAASILNPPICTFTGNVTGYDFATGQAALIENLNKLTGLTITGQVASAFNNVSLKIKNIAINGGINDSFYRTKIYGNITVNGNVLSSFNNVYLEGVSTSCACPNRGALIVNGNVGFDISSQIVFDYENFVANFPIATGSATTPTVGNFNAASTAFITDLSDGVDAQFLVQLLNISGLIASALPNPAAVFNSAAQQTALAQFSYNFLQVSSFVNAIISYDTITFTGTYMRNSFKTVQLTTKELNYTYSAIEDSFSTVFGKGFEKKELQENKYNLSCWSPIDKILVNLTGANTLAMALSHGLSTLRIESKRFELTGQLGGQLISNSSLKVERLLITSDQVSSVTIGLLSNTEVVALKEINVNISQTINLIQFANTARLRFHEFNLLASVSGAHPSELIGHRFNVQGTSANVVTSDFEVSVFEVDYICFGNLFQSTTFLNNAFVSAKKLTFKTDLSSSTNLFNHSIFEVENIVFENGFNNSSTLGNLSIFDTCNLIVEKCGTTSGTIANLAFNGSLIQAEKIKIEGDNNYSFTGATIHSKELISGNSFYSFAGALVNVKNLKFETQFANSDCKTPAQFNLDTTNTNAVTLLYQILRNVVYNTLTFELIPLDTNFLIDRLSSSTFDRSSLSLIYHPEFINLDIKVNQLVPYGIPSESYPSLKFLLDAIIGTKLKATIVNGDTISALTNPALSKLDFLKLVGTATVSQIPIATLKTLKAIEICTTVPPTQADLKLLRCYGL